MVLERFLGRQLEESRNHSCPQRLVPLTSPSSYTEHHSISLFPVGELPLVVVLPLHLCPFSPVSFDRLAIIIPSRCPCSPSLSGLSASAIQKQQYFS
jgi:hypothetical protein